MKDRKLRVKTTKGVKIKIKLRKPRAPICSACRKKLKGTLNMKTVKQKNSARTKKRPERKYGGVLCSKCARQKIKEEVRSKNV